MRSVCVPTLILFAGIATCQADQITLEPAKDTTIFEDNDGLSNGSGSHLFSGATAGRNANLVRRALLGFDFTDVPAGATVTSVALGMNVNRVPRSMVANDMSLHRLTKDFGEASSKAPGQEGKGTTAAAGDATWADAVLGTSTWDQLGGDFITDASSSTRVGGNGNYSWDSTELLVSDVQMWLDDPAMNFGWILIGNESRSRTAKRFGSSENGTVANRPQLTITFDALVSLLGDFNEDGVLNVPDINLLCGVSHSGENPPEFDLNGDGVVSAADLTVWVEDLAGTVAGDANLDGTVVFDDFLALADAFGGDGDWSTGDFDCSGTVAFPDFLALSDNFGHTAEQSATLASVPEPSSACLFALSMLLGATMRKRL